MQSEQPWYIDAAELAEMLFPEAARVWLETRRGYISPKTFYEYRINLKTLSAFFGDFRLQEISADQIRAYQQMRRAKCGPFAINHEYSVLQQMLKRIGRWAEIAPNYEALALPNQKTGGEHWHLRRKTDYLSCRPRIPIGKPAFLFAAITLTPRQDQKKRPLCG